MTIPKGPGREWRKRKEPVLDKEIMASISRGAHLIHPSDKHDYERRFYETLIYTPDSGPYKTEAEAMEGKRALNRCAKYLGYSMDANIEKAPFGGFQVKFRAICKDCGKAHVIEKYGPDPEKWPYNPYRKRNDSDHK